MENEIYNDASLELSESDASLTTEDKNNPEFYLTPTQVLTAAKQFLLGIAFLFIFTIWVAIHYPEQSASLLDICKTIFPPLATLIIAFYFKEKF